MMTKNTNNSQSSKEIDIEKLTGQKINININPEILKILKVELLSIDDLFILLALYDSYINLLDIYDGNSKIFKIAVLQYELLQLHGFIKESDTNQMYELTQKGKDLVERIRPLMDLVEEDKINEESFKQLCSDYLLLFPKIKLPSGKYARTNIVEIEKKMRNWLKTYKPIFKKEGIKLTNDDILEATKYYVTRYSKDNYRFMVTSSYFIQKNEKSALADEIQALKDGLTAKPKTNIVTM